MTTDTTPPLTEDETEAFNALLSLTAADAAGALPDGLRIALVRCTLDNEPVAALSVVAEADDDEVSIRPLALLIDDAMFARLGEPA